MINIRAYVSEKGDIFDGSNVGEQIGAALGDRLRFVEQQETRALEYQGEPFRAYLTRRFSDEKAEATLRSYVDQYLETVPLPAPVRWLGRIRRYFAIVYASAAQAIDYGILPWSKKRTLSDIAKCMADAMDQLVVDNLVSWASGKGPLTPVPETPSKK